MSTENDYPSRPSRSGRRIAPIDGNSNFYAGYAYVVSMFFAYLAGASIFIAFALTLQQVEPETIETIFKIGIIAAILFGIVYFLSTLLAFVLSLIGIISQPAHKLLGYLTCILTAVPLAFGGYLAYTVSFPHKTGEPPLIEEIFGPLPGMESIEETTISPEAP